MIGYWLTVYAIVGLIGLIIGGVGAIISYRNYVKEEFGVVESESS